MTMPDLQQLFLQIANGVLRLADFVKEPFVPGLVVFLLILSLAVICLHFWWWSRGYINAIAVVRGVIQGNSGNDLDATSEDLRINFYGRQPEVTSRLKKLGKSKSAARERIAFAWREYRETLKIDHDSQAMLNGIRPSVFFNTEDLGAEARGWRIIPALFVSIGLAATFLGLIAALQQTGETLAVPVISVESGIGISAGPTTALQQLLLIASAKFIMSLTGLFCSILFTIVLRRRLGKIEHAIDRLCIDIEKRVVFLALESLAFDQKKLMEEQKEHSQKMNTELIAAIGRSLNDELPKAISTSISDAIAPMMNQMGQAGVDGVRDIVGDIANQFSGDVSRAMGDAAERFDAASEQIEVLARTLSGNAGDVNGQMEKMVNELSRTMTEMRDGLVAGADATKSAFETGSADVLQRMSSSLGEMQKTMAAANEEQQSTATMMSLAASQFSEQVDSAGKGASEKVNEQLGKLSESAAKDLNDALKPMLETARDLSKETSERVITPVKQLTSALEGFVGRLEHGSNRFGELSTALSKGTEAATKNASLIDNASSSLRSAAEPVSALARGLTASARTTAEAATGIAGSLDGQRDVLKASMDALSGSLEQFQLVLGKYDELDEKLGGAFISFRSEVETSIKRIEDYSGDVHKTYADALSQLHAVVDQTSEFKPASRG